MLRSITSDTTKGGTTHTFLHCSFEEFESSTTKRRTNSAVSAELRKSQSGTGTST
jgi:hypothetical protein